MAIFFCMEKKLITPVILSGGSGTRLWPSSRGLYPKQLLKLTSEYSMLQQTFLRLKGLDAELAVPIVVCNHEHRFVIAEQLKVLGVNEARLILEPAAKNTAPATLVAALCALKDDPDAILLVLPADHLLDETAVFQQAVHDAAAIASQGCLVTFGVKPTRPETGYGYIKQGDALGASGFNVADFVEKPSAEKAEHYISSGNYFWNSGMFVFGAKSYIDEISQHAPDMLTYSEQSLAKAQADLDFIRLDSEAYSHCPEDSIDYAVMEKTSKAAMVPLDASWNDLGSWQSLWEALPKDEQQNVAVGDVLLHKVTNSYIRSESKLVAAVGLEDIVIVDTADAVLVASKASSQEVKSIVKQLKETDRTEHHIHNLVYRPWGSYQSLDIGGNFQVKRITVKPGARLSLQMHHHRAEHWIVVCGTAKVTRGEEEFLLTENESTYIPIGAKHRLENVGQLMLEMIEVQSGAYLGEDDIVRFEDDYKRNEQ